MRFAMLQRIENYNFESSNLNKKFSSVSFIIFNYIFIFLILCDLVFNLFQQDRVFIICLDDFILSSRSIKVCSVNFSAKS